MAAFLTISKRIHVTDYRQLFVVFNIYHMLIIIFDLRKPLVHVIIKHLFTFIYIAILISTICQHGGIFSDKLWIPVDLHSSFSSLICFLGGFHSGAHMHISKQLCKQITPHTCLFYLSPVPLLRFVIFSESSEIICADKQRVAVF